MKKKRTDLALFLLIVGIFIVAYLTGESYYNGLTGKSSAQQEAHKIYQYKYDMIVDSPDSSFWQAVYASA